MLHSPNRHARLLAWLALVPALAVCSAGPADSSGPMSPPATIASVGVSPNTATILVGQSVVLAATVDAGQTVSWTSSNTAVATVDSTRSVVGVALGLATITATSAGKSAHPTIVVVAPPPPTNSSLQ